MSSPDQQIPPLEATPDTIKGERVYKANRSKNRVGNFFAIVIILWCGWSPARDALAWIRGAAPPDFLDWVRILFAAWLAYVFVRAGIGMLRGLPRLTATETGVKLETAHRVVDVEWASLGPFELKASYVGPRASRRTYRAQAHIIGPRLSDNRPRNKLLLLSDSYDVPIGKIVVDLNARHARVTGAPPLPETDPIADETRFGVANFRAPWATFGILVFLTAVFTAEQHFAIGPVGSAMRPSLPTILALGAMNGKAVLAGQWWRLFTAPLLHADFTHLFFNGTALLFAGYALERVVGRIWYLALFIIGGVGGCLMSLALDSVTTISLGASGAIMGLCAAAFICAFRLPSGTRMQSRALTRSARILIPAVLQPFQNSGPIHIDYAAHLGGALACACVALFLVKTWPDAERLPRFRKLAAGIIVVGVVLTGFGGFAASAEYPAFAARFTPVTFGKGEAIIVTPSGEYKFSIDRAVTDMQRERGLMGRLSMPGDAAMLFVFDYPQTVSMWTKGTVFPLDLLFIRNDGLIASIREDVAPDSEMKISSDGIVRAVLALNADTVARLGIKPHDMVVTAGLGNLPP